MNLLLPRRDAVFSCRPDHTDLPAQRARQALIRLHGDIEARLAATRATRACWPCAKGCDDCCRQLAALPQLTETEWDFLRAGLAALPAAQKAAIGHRLDELGAQAARPVTCPLLDPASGACLVYAQRPVACRTYGFYVERDRGLYCATIRGQADSGDLADVVWGSGPAVDRRLADLGETRSLFEWTRG